MWYLVTNLLITEAEKILWVMAYLDMQIWIVCGMHGYKGVTLIATKYMYLANVVEIKSALIVPNFDLCYIENQNQCEVLHTW